MIRIKGFLWVVIVGASYQNLVAQNEKVFFGNLHSHTSYSDGSGKPDEAYKDARNAGLDFLAITEHNHIKAENGAKGDRKDGILIAKDNSLYNGPQSSSLVSAATRRNEDGKFVAIYGQEFSTISSGNHVNVFEIADVIKIANGDFKGLLDWLKTNKDSQGKLAIVQFNHPDRHPSLDEYGQNDISPESEWVKQMDAHADLIEVLNGPGLTNGDGERPEVMESQYLYYLDLGFHLGPVGDQDNHYKTWGTLTDARTGVITDELTKSKVLEALRSRHVYASEDKNLRVIFKINGHLCGDVIDTSLAQNAELDIKFTLQDGDEPDASYKIEVYSDAAGENRAQVIETVSLEGNTTEGSIEDIHYISPGQYIFFKVTQLIEDGPDDRVWTSPVWFEPGTVSPAIDLPLYVASRRSAVYHISEECKDAQRIKASNKLTGEEARQGRNLHNGCPRN